MVWIVLVIILGVLLIGFIVITFFLLPKIPRKPYCMVSETYRLGWWTKNNIVQIDSFQVDILESRLNLMNHKSLISYTIKGNFIPEQGPRKPIINKIHVSERFINVSNDSGIDQKEVLIEFTPVVGFVDDKNYNGGEIHFNITNERITNSYRWGENKVRFKCLDKHCDIILVQKK